MEYPTSNQNFICQHEMTDRLILMYAGMKINTAEQNNKLLQWYKLFWISMKERMDRRRAKEHFGILFIGLFCLRTHPTITMRELLLTV